MPKEKTAFNGFFYTQGHFHQRRGDRRHRIFEPIDEHHSKTARPSYQILILLSWGHSRGRSMPNGGSALRGLLRIILCSAAYLFFAHYQFRTNATWFPIVVPLFLQAPVGYVSALMWNYFEINRERKRITEALGYYVPEEVVSQVARNMLDIRRYGDTVYGACLFADVAGYTPVVRRDDAAGAERADA